MTKLGNTMLLPVIVLALLLVGAISAVSQDVASTSALLPEGLRQIETKSDYLKPNNSTSSRERTYGSLEFAGKPLSIHIESRATLTMDQFVYLPLVTYTERPPGPSFYDDFEDGTEGWTPFLNYWRNKEGQWYWDPGGGYNGSNGYGFNGEIGAPATHKSAHDALTMLLIEGSEEWTDYRLRAKFNVLSGPQVGVWFRGTYREVDIPGQWVTGYYFTIRVRPNGGEDEAVLWQLRTAEEHWDEAEPDYWYHFSNPRELVEAPLATSVERGEWHEITVEVDGAHIKCYVDDELAVDFVDTEGSIFLEGTVGLFTYGNPPNTARDKFDDVVVEPLSP
ncbi:family 16 glycoside hydrolase [Chloroflexota bacterium]